jgi:hypothetical protein
MSESKHAPGPWHYQEGADAYTHIIRAGEHRFICQLAQDTSGEAEANARLIAAAPYLLEALHACLQVACDEFHGEPWQAIELARAAIAKATGGDVR